MSKTFIRCPDCKWEPDQSCLWKCSICGTSWNTFDTYGRCPNCNKTYEETACLKSRGGCGEMNLHKDWYATKELSNHRLSLLSWFRKRNNQPPVTERDRIWINKSMQEIVNMFDPFDFKALSTVTVKNIYLDYEFKGTEDDAQFVLEKIISIMHIDAWEIKLMYYSNAPKKFSEGIVATPSENLKGSWKSSSGKYVDNGLGQKEIWIELELLKDHIDLIATIAHELAHYKLLGEYRMDKNDELITDLTAIAFGFGIFMGNSYFKFSQWTGTTHQGWKMQRKGYLPEQVIAYAMAWLAYYRDEDVSWKEYLNKSMKKYFERSYKYITENK